MNNNNGIQMYEMNLRKLPLPQTRMMLSMKIIHAIYDIHLYVLLLVNLSMLLYLSIVNFIVNHNLAKMNNYIL